MMNTLKDVTNVKIVIVKTQSDYNVFRQSNIINYIYKYRMYNVKNMYK